MPHAYRMRIAQIARIALLVAVVVSATTLPASAQEGEAAGPNTGKVSFSAGVDLTTQYMFRGIAQEDQGAIVQPWVELGFNLYEGDGPISSVDLTVGLWNSLHDGPTSDSPFANGGWYECDFYAGVSLGLPANFSFDATYVHLGAPDVAGTSLFAQEWDFTLAYDDSSWWENVKIPGFGGLQPYFMYVIETDGASDGFGNGGDSYFEFGFEPSMTLIESESMPITLSVPFTFGFGDGYYELDTTGNGHADDDDSFGYFDVGVVMSAPLSFIPADYGSWEVAAGVHFLFLGDNAETINGGDGSEVIGTIGISMSY